MMKKKIITAVAVLLLCLAFCIQSFAEFGEFGGDSDYGGGYDSGDYNGGSYDGGNYGNSYDDDKEKDNYYAYAGYPDGSDSGSGGSIVYDYTGREISIGSLNSPADTEEAEDSSGAVFGMIIVGTIAIVVIVIVRKKRKSKSYLNYSRKSVGRGNNYQSRPQGAARTNPSLLTDIRYFKQVDPNFSEQDFCEKISNMYVQFQNSWTKKNMEDLRPYLTDALFNQFNNQLDAYRRDKTTNYVERIAVLGVDIKGFMKQGDNYAVVTELRTRIVDYVTDDNTGEVIRGSKNAEKFMTYEWTLSRKVGIQTGVSDGIKSRSCPHCGAPLDINKSAKCEYCGSIIKDDAYDWVVSSIKGISQRTER